MPVAPKEKWDSQEQYLLYLRHLAAYVFAEKYVCNKAVLEIGHGAGYGADRLSRVASNVIAIDSDKESVLHCQCKYNRDNLAFLHADGRKLPFKEESFDTVVSFQVIEHIEPKNVLNYLAEIKRVLRKEGDFILSTPNKKLRLLPFQRPWNPEHKKEYSDKELKKLLSKIFEEVKVNGLYSSKEILSIEEKRVKQTPFKVFMLLTYKVLRYILPSTVLLQVKGLVKSFLKSKAYNKPIPQETFVNKFSVNEFKVASIRSKHYLDLYGICKKREK